MMHPCRMPKNGPKTHPTTARVEAFIDALATEQQRDDSRVLVKLKQGITQEMPVLCGPSSIGFGSTHLN